MRKERKIVLSFWWSKYNYKASLAWLCLLRAGEEAAQAPMPGFAYSPSIGGPQFQTPASGPSGLSSKAPAPSPLLARTPRLVPLCMNPSTPPSADQASGQPEPTSSGNIAYTSAFMTGSNMSGDISKALEKCLKTIWENKGGCGINNQRTCRSWCTKYIAQHQYACISSSSNGTKCIRPARVQGWQMVLAVCHMTCCIKGHTLGPFLFA